MKRKLLLGVAALLLIVGMALGYGYSRITHRVEGSYFDSNGVRIHYTDEGSGEPVVLIHGFAVNSDINWRWPGITEALAKEFRVIAMDLRGHGLSGKPHGPEDYGVEGIRDVVRLLDHLGLEKAHVAGYSLGGFVALRLAAMHPERLLTVAPMGAGWERVEDSKILAALDGLGEQLDAGHGISPPSTLLGKGRQKVTWLHTAEVRIMSGWFNDGKALGALLRSMPDLALTEDDLRAIPIPVCSIVADRDPLKTGVDKMVGLLRDHTVVVIEGCDHMKAPLRPEFLTALRSFLLDHRGHKEEGLQQPVF